MLHGKDAIYLQVNSNVLSSEKALGFTMVQLMLAKSLLGQLPITPQDNTELCLDKCTYLLYPLLSTCKDMNDISGGPE